MISSRAFKQRCKKQTDTNDRFVNVLAATDITLNLDEDKIASCLQLKHRKY